MNPILGDINLPFEPTKTKENHGPTTPELDRKVQGIGVSGSIAWLRVQGVRIPQFFTKRRLGWCWTQYRWRFQRGTPQPSEVPGVGGRKIAPIFCHEILYDIIINEDLYDLYVHLILNENCRNPLYIILEYMLFIAYLRIPCNMKLDPYCRDHSEIPTYTSNQPIYVLLAFFFPYSNVVQPLLRSFFGIESTCRRKCCCWWIYVTWLLYSCRYPHIPTTYK